MNFGMVCGPAPQAQAGTNAKMTMAIKQIRNILSVI